MRKIVRLAAIAIAALSLCAHFSNAQTSSAAVTGHVVDQSGGAVANATVRLVEESTHVPLTTQTNTNGNFIFTNVEPGTFTVTVTANGYKELRRLTWLCTPPLTSMPVSSLCR